MAVGKIHQFSNPLEPRAQVWFLFHRDDDEDVDGDNDEDDVEDDADRNAAEDGNEDGVEDDAGGDVDVDPQERPPTWRTKCRRACAEHT